MSKASNSRIFSIIKVILPLFIGVYLLWHFYSAMDKNTKEIFFKAIEEADYFWIIISLILGFFSHIVRAYRWKYTLEPMGHTPKFWHRYHALMIGYIVNLLIPRAGEATRAALLYRTDRISFSSSFGTIIAERVFDILMLGLVLLVAIFLSYEDLITLKDIIIDGSSDKEGSNWFLRIFMSVVVGGTLLFLILWWKVATFREKFKNFIRDVIKGVFSIFKSKNPGKFIFYTLLIWALYMTFFGICFYSFEETSSFPMRGILIGYIAGTLGIMFTNGGVGAYPYLVGVVVTFYMGGQFDTAEESEGIGKALGMIIWLSQTVGMIILGLISLVLLPRNYKKEKHDKVGASST
ncbi:MAG: lysylphosphatidylglycerol synthase transmembrane domain-containing protein [Brumimicrobium sp.]